MFGAIVLCDVPKRQARIDLVRRPIEGGFRGFSQVPPGLHYVSVQNGTAHKGFWTWVAPRQTIVKVFDLQHGFRDADPATANRYTRLALSGAIGPALLPYPHARFGHWHAMTRHIDRIRFPPPIHAQDSGTGSRFDRALLHTHSGDAASLLAEFQYAFARWLVSTAASRRDETAFARWRHLVLSAFNAGEERIARSHELFLDLVETLMHQLDLLGSGWFSPGSFLTSPQAGYMIEDMIDTARPALVGKGRTFEHYLEQRQIS